MSCLVRRSASRLTLLLSLGGPLACAHKGGPISAQPRATELPVRELFSAQGGIHRPLRTVAFTQEQWQSLWAEIHGAESQPALPPVDFEREMVIVAAAGRRGGVTSPVTIPRVSDLGDAVEVSVEIYPVPCMVYGMVTYPTTAVAVPRITRPVLFRDVLVRKTCSALLIPPPLE